jgi:hypothetical protein
MILNDEPNCQVSRILMKPRPIFSDSSENDPKILSKFVFLSFTTSGVKNRHFHQIDLDDLNLLRNRFEIGIDYKLIFFLFAHI